MYLLFPCPGGPLGIAMHSSPGRRCPAVAPGPPLRRRHLGKGRAGKLSQAGITAHPASRRGVGARPGLRGPGDFQTRRPCAPRIQVRELGVWSLGIGNDTRMAKNTVIVSNAISLLTCLHSPLPPQICPRPQRCHLLYACCRPHDHPEERPHNS